MWVLCGVYQNSGEREIIGLSGENVRRGFHLFDDFVEDSDYQNGS